MECRKKRFSNRQNGLQSSTLDYLDSEIENENGAALGIMIGAFAQLITPALYSDFDGVQAKLSSLEGPIYPYDKKNNKPWYLAKPIRIGHYLDTNLGDVGAYFDVSYSYNGTALGDIRITPFSPMMQDPYGADLKVTATITPDRNNKINGKPMRQVFVNFVYDYDLFSSDEQWKFGIYIRGDGNWGYTEKPYRNY